MAASKKQETPPYITGWCNQGWCEGIRAIPGREGIPTPRCCGFIVSHLGGKRIEIVCACGCHAEITAMYETAGLAREWPSGLWSEEDMRIRKASGEAYDPTVLRECLDASRLHRVMDLERDATEAAPKLAERDNIQTLDGVLPPHPHVEDPKKRDAGYRPRNQLLYDVKIACDTWTLGAYPNISVLNTSAIASLVNEKMPPSTGAITNILRRWQRVGFAVIGEKPLRFESYTKAGVEHGFDALEKSFKAQVAIRASELAAAHKTALRHGTR